MLGGFDMKKKGHLVISILLGMFSISFAVESDAAAKPSPADIILQNVREGTIAYKLTTPEELSCIVGLSGKKKTT